MTDAKIGPIQLTNSYLADNDTPGGGDGSEKFSLLVSPMEALQIRGLVTPMVKQAFGNRNMLNIPSNCWGLIPMDAAVSLPDNDYVNHRGLGYLITGATLSPQSPTMVQVDLEVEEILSNLLDYLRMDYTTGLSDGTQLSTTYTGQAKVDKMVDEFTTFDTTNTWYPTVSSGLSAGAFASAGGKLQATATASATGTYGGLFSANRTVFTAPFTIETTLEWVAAGTSTVHSFAVQLFNTRPITYANWDADYNNFRIIVNVTPSVTYYYVQKYVSKKWTNVVKTSLGTNKTPNFKISITADKKANVWVDVTGGTNWTSIATNIDVSDIFTSGSYYMTYGMKNNSNVGKTTNSERSEVYNFDAVTPLNVVTLPLSTPVTTATFTRASEDGTLNCYASPTGSLYYTTSIDNFYKGTVKAYNSNYADTNFHLITGTQDDLLPTKFYVTNGILKLTTTATGVTVSYWNGAGYTDLNTFVIGTINRLKITECSPMKVSFKANMTEWTLEIGKPYARVKHSTTDLSYTIKTCYYNDGATTTSPVSGASLTMNANNFAYAWNKGSGTCASPNPADNFRLLILKQNPTTIKSDVIPADTMTGIGWVNATENSSSYRDAISISKEFMFKTLQSIGTE